MSSTNIGSQPRRWNYVYWKEQSGPGPLYNRLASRDPAMVMYLGQVAQEILNTTDRDSLDDVPEPLKHYYRKSYISNLFSVRLTENDSNFLEDVVDAGNIQSVLEDGTITPDQYNAWFGGVMKNTRRLRSDERSQLNAQLDQQLDMIEDHCQCTIW